MGRSPSCEENGLKKGPWLPEEDQKLKDYIEKHGHGSWRALPRLAGLNRCGKSCRLRWTNYLRPDIKRGKVSQDEEQTVLGGLSSSPLNSDRQESKNTTESGHESPPPSTFLPDMKMTSTSSHKTSKRGRLKRVVSVPVPVPGEKSTPPSDSWAWRKYGQKPVKGSPFPRAYYRCSSSRGCPARKHVERSDVDPTMLVVTYSGEHNHPDPSVRTSCQNPSTPTRESRIDYNPEENEFADLGRPDESSVSLGDEFDWFGGMERASCAMLESPILWETEGRTGSASEAEMSGFFQSCDLSEWDNALNDDHGRGVCVSSGAEEELVDWRGPEDFSLVAEGRLPVQFLGKHVDHFLHLGPSRSRALSLRAECLMEVCLSGSNNALLQVRTHLLQDLVNLKHLDLSSSSLIKMPKLSRTCKLHSLDLHGCDNLVDASQIQHLTKLEYINLKGCISLMSLPSLMALQFLCSLDVSGCNNLRRLPPSLGCLSSLTTLDLRNCKRIQNLPKGILRLKSLQTLSISGCTMLMEHASRVPTSTFGPEGMLIDLQENPRGHSSLHTSAEEVSTSYPPANKYATGLEDTAKPSSTTQGLERHRVVLKEYMSMPVEAIHQADAFYDVQRTVDSLTQRSSNLHESASLQDLLYCLEELQENVPETMARLHGAQVSKASLQVTLAHLGSSFVQAKEQFGLLGAQFLAISDQEEELDAEIARLLAKRQQLLD